MRTHSPLFLLAALGVLSSTGSALAAVDTSKWTCQSCPYPKGTTGSVEAGIGATSDASARFGDYTGLDRKGAHLVLGGSVLSRGTEGGFADLWASDLGLDSRSLSARTGLEGLFIVRAGYSELPRNFAADATTPFLGIGGDLLTLPPGYPAAGTSTMPLGGTLQPVDIGFKKKTLDVSGSVIAFDNWTYRVSLKHDVRDGTRATAGSFFSSSSQLVAPVDQTTDQLEISASYAQSGLMASLAYQISKFSNANPALTWDSPFQPVVPGATRGQLALAPDNQFHQISASAGWQITPTIRASGDFAVGRMTQDAAYLEPTLTPSIAAALPAPTAGSLDGKVDTVNGSVRLSAAPMDGLRLNASWAHDERNNQTAAQTHALVATDIFLWNGTRTSPQFSSKQDRIKLGGEYRGFEIAKLAAGLDQDNRQRAYTEAVRTHETTVWGRVALQPLEDLSLALKLAHAQRRHSDYGIAYWFGAPENPLLRKVNLADRKRTTTGVRADYALSEKINLGLALDVSSDTYGDAVVGLKDGRSVNLSADISAALSEQTQLTAYVQGETIRSSQAGSEAYSVPDWAAQNHDRFTVLGLGVKHALIVDKLDIAADLSIARSRSQLAVQSLTDATPYPDAKTSQDSLKLSATYKLQDNLWLSGSWWIERYTAANWRYDGLAPDTLQTLLALGATSPDYRLNVLRVALRYKF